MFYVNKSNQEEVVELIYSETGVVIVIDQVDTLKAGNPVGRIIKKGKKAFKKDYKKASDKVVKMPETSESEREHIIETFVTDKAGILTYTEDYVENKKYLDRQEEMEKQTEAERVRLMKTLADDYNPNGVSVQQDKD